MITREKLITLELVAGLFRWVWLIAGAFAIYYFVIAIGFDGSWVPFVVSIVVSGISKWLTQDFDDNKKRVAIETDLVTKGMSRKEAGEAWFRAYSRQESPVTNDTDK